MSKQTALDTLYTQINRLKGELMSQEFATPEDVNAGDLLTDSRYRIWIVTKVTPKTTRIIAQDIKGEPFGKEYTIRDTDFGFTYRVLSLRILNRHNQLKRRYDFIKNQK